MTEVDRFFDTNVLLYLLSADDARANAAESALASGGTISVQVLNEFTAVATRKLALSLVETRDVLDTVRRLCRVEPLTTETHDEGVRISARYGFDIYDSMIVASALIANCSVLVSEDLQHTQELEDRLLVVNPFA